VSIDSVLLGFDGGFICGSNEGNEEVFDGFEELYSIVLAFETDAFFETESS